MYPRSAPLTLSSLGSCQWVRIVVNGISLPEEEVLAITGNGTRARITLKPKGSDTITVRTAREMGLGFREGRMVVFPNPDARAYACHPEHERRQGRPRLVL